MEFRISELMDGYNDTEFAPAPSDVSAENVKALAAARLNVTPIRKGKRVGRIVLLAATIALALSAAAVAVYQYGLRDLTLGEPDNGFVDVSVLGWRDTPEYQAFVEWEEFQTEFRAEHEIPDVKYDGNYPINYLMVGAATPEMMEALDGILDKYGLTLHEEGSILLPAEGSGIDVDAILPEAEGSAGGYAYRDGTMMLEVDQTLEDGETVEYQLFSAVKGTFTEIYGGMDSEFEEWTYTAADGTEVSLVLGEHTSMIVADMDRVFVTLHTVFRNVSGREALEELADSIRWTELNACEGFTDEYYASFCAAQSAEAKEMDLAYAAELELKDWMLSDDILATHIPESRGRSSADSEDGSAWVEWTYTALEGDGAIRVKFERPAGDIEAAFKEMRADFAGQEKTLADVPVYIRTETVEGADTVTECRDFTVYIDEAADGSATALWLDGDKDLIFTLTADPGELTGEELEAQIAYLLGGWEPYPMPVAPEVVWAKLGHYEPAYLPEGWYLNEEMQLAFAGTVDGVWSGEISQAYITGGVGAVIWFDYQTCTVDIDPQETLFEAFGYTDEVLEDPYFLFTETTVNGHPAILKELNDKTPSPVLLWLDEEAGVLFSLGSEASADADTLRAIAESVALQP